MNNAVIVQAQLKNPYTLDSGTDFWLWVIFYLAGVFV